MQQENIIRRSLFVFDTDLTRNPKLADTLFLMTIGVLLAWSLVSSIISNTALTQDHVGLLMRMIVVMSALRLVFHNKYTIYAVFGIITAVSAMFVWEMYFAEETSETLAFAVEFIIGTINYASGMVPHTNAYEQAVVWALTIGIGLFVVIFVYLWFNFFVLLGVSAIIVGISLNYGFFTFAPSFYAFALCTLANFIKYMHTRQSWKLIGLLLYKSGRAEHTHQAAYKPHGNERIKKISHNSYFALYALPMIIVCILAALALPKPAEGFARNIAATLVTTPIDRATTFVHAAFRPKHFSLSQTGFGTGSRRLGGDVALNDDVIMRIRADGPVYLTGNVLDTYTGYAWTNSLGNDTFDVGEGLNIELIERASSLLSWLIIHGGAGIVHGAAGRGETLERLRYVSRYFGHGQTHTLLLQYHLLTLIEADDVIDAEIGLFAANEVEVNIGDFRTFSAFYTGILTEIAGINENIGFMQDKNGTIVTDILMPRNTTYRFTHYELIPMFDTSALATVSYRGILRDTLDTLDFRIESFSSLGSLSVRSNHYETRYADLLRSYLIPRADWIYETYTTLPEDFPERIRSLTQHITADAYNDYERARMIESYLLRFGYTLTPGPTPPDRDFVDYFLFDLQRGYCTYFASAFVTMARSIGLPARYVEGFNVSGLPDEFGYIDVTNEQGHAWGEVYFEGFGWMRFEPTPGGGGIQLANSLNTYAANHTWIDGGWWDDDIWLDDMLGWGWEAGSQFDGYLPNSTGAAGVVGTQGVRISRLTLTVLVITLAVITSASARVLTVFRRNKSINSVNNSDAVIYGFYVILRYLKFFKIEIGQGETAMQFADKIDNRTDFVHDQLYMKDVAHIFSKARYSGHVITSQEREVIDSAIRNLDAKMLTLTGKVRYLYYKYILAVV